MYFVSSLATRKNEDAFLIPGFWPTILIALAIVTELEYTAPATTPWIFLLGYIINVLAMCKLDASSFVSILLTTSSVTYLPLF